MTGQNTPQDAPQSPVGDFPCCEAPRGGLNADDVAQARDEFRDRGVIIADLIRERDDALAVADDERRRADAAEARLAKVAALADEWEAWSPGNVPAPPATAAAYERGIRACAESLRAVLAPAPAADAAPDDEDGAS